MLNKIPTICCCCCRCRRRRLLRWIEDCAIAQLRADILNCFIGISSVELDKFYRVAKFLLDYYASSLKQPLKEVDELLEIGLATSRPHFLSVELSSPRPKEEKSRAGRRGSPGSTGSPKSKMGSPKLGDNSLAKSGSPTPSERGNTTQLNSTPSATRLGQQDQPSSRMQMDNTEGLMRFLDSLLPHIAVSSLVVDASTFPMFEEETLIEVCFCVWLCACFERL